MTGTVLVTGGTGHVGRAILASLKDEGVPAEFLWHTSEAAAGEITGSLGYRGHRVDLAAPGAVEALLSERVARGEAPSVVIHAAGSSLGLPFLESPVEELDLLWRINVLSLMRILKVLVPPMIDRGAGSVVALTALDRTQSVRAPVGLAASHGALLTLAMSLAKEVGPRGIRFNVVASGLLEGGLSRSLPPEVAEDYLNYSALRRRGTAAEVARAVVWLALHDTAMNGKVLPVNGGI